MNEPVPDQFPPGMRFVLGGMSRSTAIVVCVALLSLGAGALAATWFTGERVWSLLSFPLALAAGRYWTAIRWTDRHGRWPNNPA
jgi:hypothetical protein